MKNFFNKYPWLIFSIVTLLLIYPSFQSGYIFALDWSIKPFIGWDDLDWRNPLGWILCDVLAILFSFEIFQRILVGALIIFSGLIGWRLAKPTQNIYAQYFSGLFLIFNPFFYARTVEQTMIVGAGTVALWGSLLFFMESFREKGYRKIFLAAIFGGLAVSFFAHGVFLIGLFFCLFGLGHFLRSDKKREIIGRGIFFWLVILFLNANWIFTLVYNDDLWAANVRNFTMKDVEAFQTRAIGGDSVYFTVAALQGYWGEYQDRFVSIRENIFWRIAFFGIGALVIFGLIKSWKSHHSSWEMLLIATGAFVLAVGWSSVGLRPILGWIYENIPFYIGLRESQKWVAILVFVYAFWGSYGVKYLLENEKIKRYGHEIGLAVVFLPVFFSYSMIGGFQEWSVPSDFPKEWQEVREYLLKNKNEKKILALPWHGYVELDFSRKNVTNPFQDYFGKQIIAGNNIEFGGIYSNFSDPRSQLIGQYARKEKEAHSFVEDMQGLGVGWVILVKNEDWKNYQWLDGQIGLEKTLENEKAIVYSIR